MALESVRVLRVKLLRQCNPQLRKKEHLQHVQVPELSQGALAICFRPLEPLELSPRL